MMKKCVLLLFLVVCLLFSTTTNAQVAVNTTGNIADSSAMLDVSSVNKGILIPRITLTGLNDATTINNPANSLLIWNTGTSWGTAGYYYNRGTKTNPNWQIMGSGAEGWSLTGNSGTTIKTNFLGTTDNNDLEIRTNNLVRTRITTKGQIEIFNTGESVFVGKQAGTSDDLSDNKNVAVGAYSLMVNTTGYHNTAMGFSTLKTNIGDSNTAIGAYSLYKNTLGRGNVGVGVNSLFSNTSGYGNVAVGVFSLNFNTTGYGNTASGTYSLYKNTTGFGNTASGVFSLFENTNGNSNTAYGMAALHKNDTGHGNTGIGTNALYSNVSGYANTTIGVNSLRQNTIGYGNTASGAFALSKNISGCGNTASGVYSLYYHIKGGANTVSGVDAMRHSNVGNNANTAIGFRSMYGKSSLFDSCNFNTAMGSYSLFKVRKASENVVTGYRAMYSITNSIGNVVSGSYAMHGDTNLNGNASYNVAIGYSSMVGLYKANYNTAVGYKSMQVNRLGNQNTAVGAESGPMLPSLFNTSTLGHNAFTIQSNSVQIGNSSVALIGGQVAWTAISDGRFKENIKEKVKGLDFIMKLRPVTYNFNIHKQNEFLGIKSSEENDYPEKYDIEKINFTGFIAQEVEKAAKELNYDFSGVKTPKNDKDFYGLRYSEFVVPLVKATQEQQKVIVSQKEEIELLKKQNEQQNKLNKQQNKQIEQLFERIKKLENK